MDDISHMDTTKLDALVAKNLASLIEEKGLAHTRLSTDAGLSRSAVRDIINRKSRSPSYATLVRIADAANVPVERLTIGPQLDIVSAEERKIIELVLQLPDPLRRKLLGYAEGLLDSQDRVRLEPPEDGG